MHHFSTDVLLQVASFFWPLVEEHFLRGAAFWEACPRKHEISSDLSVVILPLLPLHFASLGKWHRPFSSVSSSKGRARTAEAHQMQLSHIPKGLGNHLMKAICWYWAHLTQVLFQDYLEMTQRKERGLVMHSWEMSAQDQPSACCSMREIQAHLWGFILKITL